MPPTDPFRLGRKGFGSDQQFFRISHAWLRKDGEQIKADFFDVTNINNSVASTGSIHNAGNAVSVGYGRSYFIGLNFQWNKK